MFDLQPPRHISTPPFATDLFSASAARCPLYLQERPFKATPGIVAMCQLQTFKQKMTPQILTSQQCLLLMHVRLGHGSI